MEQLGQKIDKRLYALKGGCNLRFFFDSIRYSEDIDLDVHTIAPQTLRNAVNKILSSVPFQNLLKTKSITISDFTTPKQTQTTQRWKIQLLTPTQSLPTNTKIEFSRRSDTTGAVTEHISKALTLIYQLRPIYITHYNVDMALNQKIKALILRNETQARDIFDIYHLIHRHKIRSRESFKDKELHTAIENTMSISFSEFKSQVISYLEPNYQYQFDDANIWNAIVTEVCNFLEDRTS